MECPQQEGVDDDAEEKDKTFIAPSEAARRVYPIGAVMGTLIAGVVLGRLVLNRRVEERSAHA